MTLQVTHGGLAPNGKIDFIQFKNMKFAYSMKLCHIMHKYYLSGLCYAKQVPYEVQKSSPSVPSTFIRCAVRV